MDTIDLYNIRLPRALFELILYFYVNEKHFKLEGLFRKNGSQPEIERLNTHLIFCDYLIMNDESIKNSPHEVANFISRILRELDEPLVSYNLFVEMLACNKTKIPDE